MSSLDHIASDEDDEAKMDAHACIRGARHLIELMAEQLGDDGSQLASNPQHASACLYGINRLLQRAESHLIPSRHA